MGRESTITYDQVALIAEAMTAAGIKPTSRTVQERLGHTGSLEAINRLISEWKASQARQVSFSAALPAAVQRGSVDFMEQEFSRAKAGLTAELAEQRQVAANLATENERLADAMAESSKTIVLLNAQIATLQGCISQLESELVAVRAASERELQSEETAARNGVQEPMRIRRERVERRGDQFSGNGVDA